MPTPDRTTQARPNRREPFPILAAGPYLNHAAIGPWPRCAAEAVQAFADENLHLDSTALRDMMAALPHEQQEMLQLAFFQGMSHSEIAGKTNIPLGTVKTRLRLAMQRLRNMWQMEHPAEDEKS